MNPINVKTNLNLFMVKQLKVLKNKEKRCKSQWYEESETSSKFVQNLEKRRLAKKLVNKYS